MGEAVPGGSVGEDGWRPDVGCMVDEAVVDGFDGEDEWWSDVAGCLVDEAVAGGLVELEDELCTDVGEEAR